MADGGKTATFQDKVNAVASRLIDTDVPKKLQKDYGKKYNKEEAYLAANRIIGSQMSKEMADGGDTKKGLLLSNILHPDQVLYY
jgi:hypothetical protein